MIFQRSFAHVSLLSTLPSLATAAEVRLGRPVQPDSFVSIYPSFSSPLVTFLLLSSASRPAWLSREGVHFNQSVPTLENRINFCFSQLTCAAWYTTLLRKLISSFNDIFVFNN